MTGQPSVRILHLTSSFPLEPSSISGIFIYRLICCFPENIKISVLTPDPSWQPKKLVGNFQLHTFRYAPKLWQILSHEAGGLPAAMRERKWCFLLIPVFLTAMLLKAVLLAQKNDVIHAHWSINGVLAGIAGFLTRTPVITTLRGEDVGRGQSSRMHRALLHLCLRSSDLIVTVSGKMRQNILAEFAVKPEKVLFVPNGVDESLFAIPGDGKEGRVRILVLGTLIPVKGVDIVLSALSECMDIGAWRLTLAGTGPEKKNLQTMVNENGMVGRVEFVNQIPPEKVGSLLAETDILIQASHREGRPNAVIEAMAAGVAVIGSDIEGINELIEHEANGLLFPAGHAEQLAEQLRPLLASHEKRKELGIAGRQTLLDRKITWQNCQSSYVSLYQRLAGNEVR